MSRQVLAMGVLLSLHFYTVFSNFGQLGLQTCFPSEYRFHLDTQSTVVVSNCTQSSATVQFNITVPHAVHDVPFVVVDLVYNNTNQQKVKTNLLSGAPTTGYQTRHFAINPPLANVTRWTLLFCYEDKYGTEYRLKDVTCEIETDTSSDEDYNDDGSWISSTAIGLGAIIPSIYPTYSLSWSSSKVLVMLKTSLPPVAMVTTSLTGIESLSHTIMLQEQNNSIMIHDNADSTHQPVATVTFNTTGMIKSQTTPNGVDAGSQEFVIVLIVSLCVCITVIVTSFSLAVCIYRITKKSRESTTPTTDDQSQELGINKVHQFPPCITPSPSIITTMSPLLWELDIPTVNHTFERPAESNYPNSVVTHDDLTLDIAAFNSNGNIVSRQRESDREIMHGKDKSSSTIISESSDTSNSTMNMGSLQFDVDDSVSYRTSSSYGLQTENPPRQKSCSPSLPFCYDEKALGTSTDGSSCSATLSNIECTSETQYYVLKSTGNVRTNNGVTRLSMDITDSSNNSTDDSNNVYIVFNS